MKHIVREILISLAYLTPIGYLINLYKLQTGKRTPGVYIHLTRDEPIKVMLKKNPLVSERVQWFGNGTALIFQSIVIATKGMGGSWGDTYVWIALLYGVVNMVSAIFPNINWNESEFKSVKIPIILIVLIASLVLAIIGTDIIQIYK